MLAVCWCWRGTLCACATLGQWSHWSGWLFYAAYNISMSRSLLLLIFTIALLHCKSSIHHVPGSSVFSIPLFSITSSDLTVFSRDTIAFIVTQCLGSPPFHIQAVISLLVPKSLYSLYYVHNPIPLFYFPKCTKRPVFIAISRALILLLLFSSGDVQLNPGPVTSVENLTSHIFSFDDFCNRKIFGFMHINIRSLLPKTDCTDTLS